MHLFFPPVPRNDVAQGLQSEGPRVPFSGSGEKPGLAACLFFVQKGQLFPRQTISFGVVIYHLLWPNKGLAAMINNMKEFAGRPLDLTYPVLQLHLQKVSSLFFWTSYSKNTRVGGFFGQSWDAHSPLFKNSPSWFFWGVKSLLEGCPYLQRTLSSDVPIISGMNSLLKPCSFSGDSLFLVVFQYCFLGVSIGAAKRRFKSLTVMTSDMLQ